MAIHQESLFCQQMGHVHLEDHPTIHAKHGCAGLASPLFYAMGTTRK
jgi:hypothetical protein